MSQENDTKNNQPDSATTAWAESVDRRLLAMEGTVGRLSEIAESLGHSEERIKALEIEVRTSLLDTSFAGRLSSLEKRVGASASWSETWAALNKRLIALEKASASPEPLLNDELADRLARIEEDNSKRFARIEQGFSKLEGDFDKVASDAANAGLSPEQLYGVQSAVLNLSNIFLRTGNHEVRTAVKEVARGFCFLIGQSHSVFFPDAPNSRQIPEPNAATVLPGAPGPGFPAAAQVNGMVAAMAAHAPVTPGPGISVPGLPPSPYAIPSQQDPQGASHPVMGTPAAPGVSPQAAPGECRMEVVSDPSGQMTANGGPPAGTPGLPGHVPLPAQVPGAMPPSPGVPFPTPAQPPVSAPPQPAASAAEGVTLDQLAAQFSPMGGNSP